MFLSILKFWEPRFYSLFLEIYEKKNEEKTSSYPTHKFSFQKQEDIPQTKLRLMVKQMSI